MCRTVTSPLLAVPIPRQHCSGFPSAFITPWARRAQKTTQPRQNPLHGKGHPKQRSLLTSKFSPHYSQSTAWRQSLDKGKVPEFLRAHKHFATASVLPSRHPASVLGDHFTQLVLPPISLWHGLRVPFPNETCSNWPSSSSQRSQDRAPAANTKLNPTFHK